MDNTNFFDYSIVSRGRTIFREKSYDIKAESKQSLDSIVHGTNDYRVHLEFNDSGKLLISKSSCTCPCQYPCKHMAAMVLHHDQKYKDEFAVAELNKAKNKSGKILLDVIERDIKDITAYYSSSYSKTKLISDSLDKIDRLNRQGKLVDCEEKCQSILENLLAASFKTDARAYYANFYVDPVILVKKAIKIINDIGFPNKDEIIMNSMLSKESLSPDMLKYLLTHEDTSSSISSVVELIVKEKKEGELMDAITTSYNGIDIQQFPKDTIGFFFYNFFDRIGRDSKKAYISDVFKNSNVNEIKNLIDFLMQKGMVDLLSLNQIEKLDEIDHKEALRVILSYKTDYDLSWISYFLRLVKEEDTNERFQFEITLDNLIKKGIYAPLLLRSSSKVDIRKIAIEEIYAISDYIKDEYKPRVVEYTFKKAEKDLDMKTDKIDEIISCCETLDKLDSSYCTRLLLSSKLESKVKVFSWSTAIYFQLLDKYNLIEEKGYKPYRG